MKSIRPYLLLFITFCFTTISVSQAEILDSGADIGDEPLPPEQAFALSTKVIDADMIRVEWDIVDGYYLYRKKISFTSDTKEISLQPGNFPKGGIHEDEFFGKVETYRGKVGIDIPLKRTGSTQTLDMTIVSQGCADIGICYPPQKQTVSLTLPVMPAIADTSSGNDSLNPLAALKKLSTSLGLVSDEEEFLPAEQVFILSTEVENANLIKASWVIKKGYYLYRDKFTFELQDAKGVTIGKIQMPEGQKKLDANFGDMIVYHDAVEVLIPLIRDNLEATEVTLVAKFQGCAERGFCYPPQKQLVPIALPKASVKQVAQSASKGDLSGEPEVISEQDEIAAALAGGSTIVTILSFFGFGLLLAFTPCVFPMIPILSSIIIGQGDKLSTRKAFIMSLVYVLAMAVTYTFAGVMAGLFGSNLQAAFQDPWILGTFSAVFVALAFSMFGFYNIQMPASLQSKLTEFSNKQEGGTLIGVAIMGFLSALIVGPCVAAPLAGALIYIGQTGDAWLGGAALFSLSLGMGAPLLAIGVSAGKLLPKAGAWMDAVKGVFGVMMLAVAVWMLERIIPAEIAMLLWALLLIISAVYMGAVETIREGASGWMRLWKGLGIAILLYGSLIIIGAASGGKDVLQPLANLNMGASGGGSVHKELEFKKIRGLDGLSQALASAKAAGKMTMLDFYADWCVSCKEMEKYTFADPDVQKALSNVVLLQADVTANDDTDKALLKKFGLVGPPSIIFFGIDGEEKRAYRLVGYLKADKFAEHVRRLQK